MTHKFKNELTTLPQFEALVEIARAIDGEAPTAELGRLAGIKDSDELMGALRTLEAQGVIHERQGQRRQILWLPGKSERTRSESERETLLPYQRIPKLLAYFGRTPIATAEIAREVWSEAHKGPERTRGALKVLVALGLVEAGHHSAQAITWWWRAAEHNKPYMAGLFGNVRAPLHIADDTPMLNSRGEKIADTPDELVSFRDWDQSPWNDL